MAKKITFAHTKQETIDKINEILEMNFVSAFMRKQWQGEAKTLQSQLETARNNGTDTVEYVNKLQLIDYKRKALASWRKNTLMPTKNDKGVTVEGLYGAVGCTVDLAKTYCECRDSGTWTKWNKAIKAMLNDVFEFDAIDEKLVGKFASYLEHAVGTNIAGINQVLNGTLLKPATTAKFTEIMVNAIATYMAKTCDSINIPTVEFYTASVEFDETVKKVVSYTVEEKEEEKKEEK